MTCLILHLILHQEGLALESVLRNNRYIHTFQYSHCIGVFFFFFFFFFFLSHLVHGVKVSFCDHILSVVRPSVRKQFLQTTSSP